MENDRNTFKSVFSLPPAPHTALERTPSRRRMSRTLIKTTGRSVRDDPCGSGAGSSFVRGAQPLLPPRWYSHAAKRLLDVLAAAFGLLLLSPVLGLLSILIKRDSPGPVFYRGARMGKDGRVFKILKFRTMREEAASYAGPF